MRRFLSAVIAGVLAFAGRSTPPADQDRRRAPKAGPDLSADPGRRRDPVQEVEEGAVFTLLVPDKVMESSHLSSGIISYRLVLTRGPNGLEINGRADWQDAGPPCMREVSASPIQHKGQRFFYTESGSQIHVSFDPQTVDIRSALLAFMIAGPPSSEAARKYRHDHDSVVRGIHGKSQ
jgi:hypothetical protein